MRDDERPTTPGTLEAAEAADGGVHDRDTIPAPPPSDALENTPPFGLRLEGLVREAQLADDGHRGGDEPVAVEPPSIEIVEGGPELELRSEEEVDTWRPPPPDVPVEVQSSSASDVSSIAPREVAKRPEPSAQAPRGAVIALVLAACIGFAATWMGMRRAPEASPPAAATASPSSASEPKHDRHAPVDVPDEALVAGPAAPSADALAAGESELHAPVHDVKPVTGAPLGGATPKVARRARPAPPTGPLPEAPGRDDIAAVLNAMRGDMATCAAGRTGVAELDLTVHGSGHVAHAVVSGDFAGTPQGSCIARTLRKARFAPFERPKFRVLYRLML
jgi:hypothetical protein